jgi:hypothetical protein
MFDLSPGPSPEVRGVEEKKNSTDPFSFSRRLK